MRWLAIFFSIIWLMVAAIPAGFAEEGLPAVNIGIVTDGPWKRYEETIDLVKREVSAIMEGEFEVRFPPEQTLDGNWSVSGIDRAIDALLADPDVDLVIALGTVASHKAAVRRTLQKPVIAPFVMDTEIQKLPLKEGTSGVDNLSYIDVHRSVDRDIQTFREIAHFDRLTFLADSLTLEAIPEIRIHVKRVAESLGVEFHMIAVKDSIKETLEEMPLSTEAVFIAPLFRVSQSDLQKLITEMIERRLPTFSYWGSDEVEQGILASSTPASTMQHIARHIAANAHDIVRGENAGSLTVGFRIGKQLTINMATARAIDIYPGLSILTEADLLNEDREDIQRVLTLEKAVQEAITANLDLAAADRGVAAGAQAVLEARSVLLPQLDIGSQAVLIDEDRAKASGGQAPERRWAGSADASLLLYSDRAWSGYTVQKHFQDSRIEGRRALQLDIIQSSSTAYLEVLRAKTIERIQKNNLKLTRANLERAHVRQTIGVAGPEEVYRWDSEIAKSRQVVLRSESASMSRMNRLNRILHRPLQELFIAQEADLSDPVLSLSDRLFFNLVNNPKNFSVFGDFMVKEGIGISPELQQFDAEITALKRTAVSAERAFWLPDFSLQANMTELIADGGEGTDPVSIGPFTLDTKNDTDWSIGIFATFPLFTGGQKRATLQRTREELDGLKIERDATAERIEERIRTAINVIRSSYPGIQLSRDASDAADKNLELVTDSYERGVKSIIDLLDAQNQALVADLNAANAVYDFLIDLMNLQRAVGRFDFFLSDEERQAWFRRFEAFSK